MFGIDRQPVRGGAQVAVVYPIPRDRDAGALTVREVQILHLMTLAVELDVLRRSTLLSLNRHDVPVLYAGPEHLKIKAEQRGDQWLYIWGRGPPGASRSTGMQPSASRP